MTRRAIAAAALVAATAVVVAVAPAGAAPVPVGPATSAPTLSASSDMLRAASSAVLPAAAIPLPPQLNLDAVRNPVWYADFMPGGDLVPWPRKWPRPMLVRPTASGALTGRVIVVDPGHNLGNSYHTDKLGGHYFVGLDKGCNTTGTATASGYSESAYTWDVANRLARKLAAQGAAVVLTRDRETASSWGPCIRARGMLGGQVGADITVSIHADGMPGIGGGAFAYTAKRLAGWTSPTKARRSYRLGSEIIAALADRGLHGSDYMDPDVFPDANQGTINSATKPVVIVETLNMGDPHDARIAESADGRQRVADGLADGVLGYFAAR